MDEQRTKAIALTVDEWIAGIESDIALEFIRIALNVPAEPAHAEPDTKRLRSPNPA